MNIDPITTWGELRTHLKEAQKWAQESENHPDPQERDNAVSDLVNATEAVILCLELLDERGSLDQIGDFLAVTYGRAN